MTFQQYGKYKCSVYAQTIAYENKPEIIGLILCICFTLLIGLRPLNVIWQFGDSVAYNHGYNAYEGLPFTFDWHTDNFIWDNLLNFWSSNRLGMSNLFLLGDAIYFGCTYLACRKWFPNDTTAAYLAFLGAFSTYSYSYNGVKAGIAASIFLLGMAYYEKRLSSIVLVLISWGFHHSMQLPVAAYVLTLFFKNPKWYFYGWLFCVTMAVFHISFFQNLFANMTDEGGTNYLFGAGNGTDDGTVGGFRIDFLLYSAAPVWIGYKLVMKEQRQVSILYSTLLNMYLCTNGVWMLCMYANFTNRIAYLSWFMYPFVLIYPFLKEDLSDSLFLKGQDQHQFFSKVLMYHLTFTLFMDILFYQFIKAYK